MYFTPWCIGTSACCANGHSVYYWTGHWVYCFRLSGVNDSTPNDVIPYGLHLGATKTPKQLVVIEGMSEINIGSRFGADCTDFHLLLEPPTALTYEFFLIGLYLHVSAHS